MNTLGKGQPNLTIWDKGSSSVKGKIQQVLKNPIFDEKRRLAVAEANRKRAALHSQDRERLRELFKTEELKPPPKCADEKVHRYYRECVETWVDLKLCEQRENAPHSLSQVRNRHITARNKYDTLLSKRQRTQSDNLVEKNLMQIEHDFKHPEEAKERQKLCDLYVEILFHRPDIALDALLSIFPPEIRKNFEGIERVDRATFNKRVAKFDRGNTGTTYVSAHEDN